MSWGLVDGLKYDYFCDARHVILMLYEKMITTSSHHRKNKNLISKLSLFWMSQVSPKKKMYVKKRHFPQVADEAAKAAKEMAMKHNLSQASVEWKSCCKQQI